MLYSGHGELRERSQHSHRGGDAHAVERGMCNARISRPSQCVARASFRVPDLVIAVMRSSRAQGIWPISIPQPILGLTQEFCWVRACRRGPISSSLSFFGQSQCADGSANAKSATDEEKCSRNDDS